MKIKHAKVKRIIKPFYKDDNMSIAIADEEGKMKAFIVSIKGKDMSVEVVKNNILKAWKKVEKLTSAK